jgi:hypothetical protein
LGSTLAIGVGSAALEWAHTTVANTLRNNDLPLTALDAVPTGTLDVGVGGYSFAIGNIALATFAAIVVNQILLYVERFSKERNPVLQAEQVQQRPFRECGRR